MAKLLLSHDPKKSHPKTERPPRGLMRSSKECTLKFAITHKDCPTAEILIKADPSLLKREKGEALLRLANDTEYQPMIDLLCRHSIELTG